MAIDPLQLAPAAALRRQGSAAGGGAGNGVFQDIMARIARSGGSCAPAEVQAAAELLRVAMLHSSLAIAGESAAPPGVPAAPLDVLEGLARYAQAAPLKPAAGATAPGAGEARPTGEITRTASHFLGVPYRFGGETPAGIDCSSFVQQVFREHKIELPRTAREQIEVGSEVAPGELKEGDLVFFRTYASYPSHVGIYLGNGKMIHASSREGEVTVSDLNSDYFQSRFLGAKRVA